jgi:SOS-response transcriptional repressor LexA
MTPALSPESVLDMAAGTALGQNVVLRVTDDAFAAEYIVAGDMLVVHRQHHADLGDFVLATVNGRAVVGTLTRKGPSLWIRSREPLIHDRAFVDGVDDIDGVIVAVIRNTRKAA